MTIKELIEELKNIDENSEVILSSDSEGNKYSPYSDFGIGYYVPNTSWEGEILDYDEVQDELSEEHEIYEENKDIAKKCVILYPIN